MPRGGYHCAMTVLDASGRTIIAFQDDGAALHVLDVSHKKAYTALVYRRPSKDVVEGWSKKMAGSAPLMEGTLPNPPIEGTIAFGGGLPIIAGTDIVGAIGISGAPGWEKDEAVARADLGKSSRATEIIEPQIATIGWFRREFSSPNSAQFLHHPRNVSRRRSRPPVKLLHQRLRDFFL